MPATVLRHRLTLCVILRVLQLEVEGIEVLVLEEILLAYQSVGTATCRADSDAASSTHRQSLAVNLLQVQVELEGSSDHDNLKPPSQAHWQAAVALPA